MAQEIKVLIEGNEGHFALDIDLGHGLLKLLEIDTMFLFLVGLFDQPLGDHLKLVRTEKAKNLKIKGRNSGNFFQRT